MATQTKNRQVKRESTTTVLRVSALEIRQGANRKLYSFAVDGKLIHEFCTVSRVSRHDGEGLNGYQRPEVVSHINQIRDYLESENPLLPNAIVVAFDKSVRFYPTPRAEAVSRHSRPGVLEIPMRTDILDHEKPGWIVDGQQRAAALRDARVSEFPVCVVGFLTDGLEEQRQQFILVNATKPLPKGLIYELLPSTEGKLPTTLARRKKPALIAERLNYDEDSPLKGLVRTPTNSNGLVADNSILKLAENSLTDGVLYVFDDIEDQLQVLKRYWTAVKNVFPSAWGLPPRKSRLMHGAGIVAMGFLMDTIADRHRRTKELTTKLFESEIKPLKSYCHWTEGTWTFGPNDQFKWNEIQNVPGHIQLLSNYLLIQYRRASR